MSISASEGSTKLNSRKAKVNQEGTQKIAEKIEKKKYRRKINCIFEEIRSKIDSADDDNEKLSMSIDYYKQFQKKLIDDQKKIKSNMIKSENENSQLKTKIQLLGNQYVYMQQAFMALYMQNRVCNKPNYEILCLHKLSNKKNNS